MCGRVESFLGVEPSSFNVVSESALSAAGPRVPRGHVPPGFEVPTEAREVFFFIISFHLGFCVCVCVCEASSSKVELD